MVCKAKGEYKEKAKAERERERRTNPSPRLSVLQPKSPSTSHLSDLGLKRETAII